MDRQLEGERSPDRYLIQFWPAPPAADRVLKVTSATAASAHEFARRMPAPPTPEERAEEERQAALESEGGWNA